MPSILLNWINVEPGTSSSYKAKVKNTHILKNSIIQNLMRHIYRNWGILPKLLPYNALDLKSSAYPSLFIRDKRYLSSQRNVVESVEENNWCFKE